MKDTEQVQEHFAETPWLHVKSISHDKDSPFVIFKDDFAETKC